MKLDAEIRNVDRTKSEINNIMKESENIVNELEKVKAELVEVKSKELEESEPEMTDMIFKLKLFKNSKCTSKFTTVTPRLAGVKLPVPLNHSNASIVTAQLILKIN